MQIFQDQPQRGLWNELAYQFGDWLDPPSPPDDPGQATTHKVLVADAYLLEMTKVMSKMCEALGKMTCSEKYANQHVTLRDRFNDRWVVDGALSNRTQTAYAMAIAFDLLPEMEREGAIATLREIVADNDYLVGTGFAGTPPLSQALVKANATEDFYRMLLQTQVPSWLYQVVMGDTTTWERFDSMLPNGTVNPGEMTSFNHYAFGSVDRFLHEVIGGIAHAEPGYKTVDLRPVPGGGIVHAEARHIGPYGEIVCKWFIDEAGFHLQVKVPPNSKAVVTLPGSGRSVTVGSGTREFLDPGFS